MSEASYGRLLAGSPEILRSAWAQWARQPVDWDLTEEPLPPPPARQTTLARTVSVQGPGTFFGQRTRTLTFEPAEANGWWFERQDREDALPFPVSARNVWTTGDVVSNIVLRAGPPHNYVRMVEHIIALKIGLHLDHVRVRTDSGDPPLFARGSLDLIEALAAAGLRELDRPADYYTVTETVTVCDSNGGFLTLSPSRPGVPELSLDCAVDFPNAIGRQRVRFRPHPARFHYAAEARTNTTALKMLYCKTAGKLFADVRNLGYTQANILIAGRCGYYNAPRLLHAGKSLEAVWHRAALDLLAALALVEEGRFAGGVISYKAGHALDVQMLCKLYKHGLLRKC
ncbi:MAG: UDP-3-O-acyl-N-acetylglucosamine deacetylase [Kiritimatiellaeota bacterium]|nr:UDP-3-O-acyl-N-acetylglucosamine deacetylase [Kiritimatiellota bacterium]